MTSRSSIRVPRCFLPSTRLTSSSEKNRQLISMPFCERTSRIHLDVWYTYGHMTSKWKSTEVISGCMAQCTRSDRRAQACG